MESSPVVPENPEPLNLTTIVDDCKKLIFEYLGLNDLVNIAGTSKQLNSAVCNVFEGKYGKEIILLGSLSEDANNQYNWKYPRRVPIVTIRSPALVLKTLRYFGHLISDIQISYSGLPCTFNRRFIELYLSNYCSQSLIHLSAYNSKSAMVVLTGIKKQMLNVRTVRLEVCGIGGNNEIFPNLETLILGINYYENLSMFKVNIPTLKNLSFCGEYKDRRWNHLQMLGNECIEMIELNPQLEGLHLDIHRNSPKLMQSVIGLRSLRRFSLIARDNQELKGEVFHFENLMEFRTNVDLNLFTFGELGRLSIAGPQYCRSLDHIGDYLNRNKHLKSVHFEGLWDEKHESKMVLDELLRIEYIVSDVEKLHICYHSVRHFPFDAVLQFIKRSQSLTELSIRMTEYSSIPYCLRFLSKDKIEVKASTSQTHKTWEFTIERLTNLPSMKCILYERKKNAITHKCRCDFKCNCSPLFMLTATNIEHVANRNINSKIS